MREEYENTNSYNYRLSAMLKKIYRIRGCGLSLLSGACLAELLVPVRARVVIADRRSSSPSPTTRRRERKPRITKYHQKDGNDEFTGAA
jgi:hypothetical protein